MIYKYSQLSNDERMNYDEMRKIDCGHVGREIHLGQLKLLITELMFLSKKSEKGNKVVYVGAAEGYHTAKLADMFPQLTFELWDPGKFTVLKRDNIKIFNAFFTTKNAQDYAHEGNNILFISDIRNLEISAIKTG